MHVLQHPLLPPRGYQRRRYSFPGDYELPKSRSYPKIRAEELQGFCACERAFPERQIDETGDYPDTASGAGTATFVFLWKVKDAWIKEN